MLSFKQALNLAYRNNPDLQAQIAQAQAAKGQVIQSHRFLNPTLTLESENIGGSGEFSGFESAESTVYLTQPIPLGGKWSFQQKVAQARYASMQAAIARKKSELYIQVGKAYVDVIYAQQWYQTTGQLVKLSQDIVNDVERKIRSGASKQLDLEFAKIDLTNEKIMQMRARRDLNIAKGKLAQTLGKSPETRFTYDAHSMPHRIISWPIIKKRMLKSIFLCEKSLIAEVNRLLITATKRNVWPTLAMQLGARHFSDDHSNAFVVQASSGLPLFDRNQGNLVTAEAQYTQAL
jgi:cobalt-zinc-cadmium efflux system outer membrane protein